jgi:hypothetical protein
MRAEAIDRYPGRDSNPHALEGQWILSPQRLTNSATRAWSHETLAAGVAREVVECYPAGDGGGGARRAWRGREAVE